MPTVKGAFHLFRFSGISVFLHWSWFAVALFEVVARRGSYPSIVWNLAEYLILFVLVTLHEFGHAFACRSVGGKADRIVLWPLGGVAFVEPPERPGAWLWSIAAGPLVNLALLPVLGGLWWWTRNAGMPESAPHAYELIRAVLFMDAAMLVFNLLPFHPLDGGQIVRALLWYVVGRARSLSITALLGFVGATGLVALAIVMRSIWFAVLGVFFTLSCVAAWRRAKMIARLESAPPRPGFACPACGTAPPVGELWNCNRCRTLFDTFATSGRCPKCGAAFAETKCNACGKPSEVRTWDLTPPVLAAETPAVDSSLPAPPDAPPAPAAPPAA